MRKTRKFRKKIRRKTMKVGPRFRKKIRRKTMKVGPRFRKKINKKFSKKNRKVKGGQVQTGRGDLNITEMLQYLLLEKTLYWINTSF